MGNSKKETVFREVMGNYPTGVTVVTTTDHEGNPVGLTVNSFASVSLDPLMILWSIDYKSSGIRAFQENKKFAVHILAEDQQEECIIFSTNNIDRFSKVQWKFSENQLPIIKGSAAVLECETFQAVEAGDHTVLIGAVKNIKTMDRDPLLYHRRRFGPIPAEFHSLNE